MVRRLSVVLVACAAAATGCSKHHGGQGIGGGHNAERLKDAGVVLPVAGAVGLLVDGIRVANVDPAQAQWTPIASLVPPKQARARDAKNWALLEIHTSSGRITTMPEPGATQANQIAALVPGKDGVDFGMFSPDDLAKHGNPKLVETGVIDVRIDVKAPDVPEAPGSDTGSDTGGDSGSASGGGGNGEGNGANRTAGDAPDLSKVKLTIATGTQEIEVTGDDLAKIAKIAPPTGDTDTTGWNLLDVLAAKQLSAPANGRTVVTDADGAMVQMTAVELDPRTGLAFLKVNRKGELRFRLFQKNAGGAWDVAGELRGVDHVTLSKH